MKNVYSNQNGNKKKAELRKLVLMQLAKVRKKLKKEHPGMLEKMGAVLEKNKAEQHQKPQKHSAAGDVRIDHDKNVESIEKMLMLKAGNPNFEKAVKTMLSKHKG